MRAGVGAADPEMAILWIDRAVRREILQMAVAIENEDDDGVSIASIRLRWAVACAEHVARGAWGELALQLDRLRARAAPWLSTDGLVFSADALRHLATRVRAERAQRGRRIDASGVQLVGLDLDDLDLSGSRFRGTYLTDVAARRAIFELVDASESYLHECRLYGGAFHGATFDGSGVTDSDVSCANLTRTSWRRAEVVGCTLLGASFADACLDDATFTECDLRGASFAVTRGVPASAAGARFIDCDLRDTRWAARDLSGVALIDCRLYGAHGAPMASDVAIERPDLSSAGDGSRMGTRSDVIAAWAGTVGPGIDRREPR